MKERCCKNCRYAIEGPRTTGYVDLSAMAGNSNKTLICKKNPPTSNCFPKVNDLDWCYCFDEDRPVKKYEVAYGINEGQYTGFIHYRIYYGLTANEYKSIYKRINNQFIYYITSSRDNSNWIILYILFGRSFGMKEEILYRMRIHKIDIDWENEE